MSELGRTISQLIYAHSTQAGMHVVGELERKIDRLIAVKIATTLRAYEEAQLAKREKTNAHTAQDHRQ